MRFTTFATMAVACLIGTTAFGGGYAEGTHPARTAETATTPTIRIDFAEPGIPDIHHAGSESAVSYGVHDGPLEQQARDRVALLVGPPRFQPFALAESDNETIRLISRNEVEIRSVLADPTVPDRPLTAQLPEVAPAGEPVRTGENDARRAFDYLEYQAHYAQWRAALVQAFLHHYRQNGAWPPTDAVNTTH